MLAGEIKRRLRAGEVSLGGWLTIAHESVAEIIAAAGLDWVIVDMEHTAIDVSEALRLLMAIEGRGTVGLVRLAALDPARAKAALDSGAAGIVVPMIMTAQDAEAAVRSAKYPPRGTRGAGLARTHDYGPSFDEYFRRANDETLVVAQVEHIDAVERIDEIVAVSGLDGTFIGPYDLSASMGLAGQLGHPDVLSAVDRVVHATVGAGLAPGIHLVHPERIPDELGGAIARGFRFIALGTDALLLGHGARRLASEARKIAQR